MALKVLPHAFVADEARLARFSREAQLLASLNHPNIAGIHGIEEVGDVTALVLELVEGETLQERIARGPLPVEEVLRIGVEIAEALEAAHERGIIHRDLKPGNVKFGADDRVKVLDFGLAKAFETEPGRADATHSPTLSLQQATEAGVILGTAAYMAPEQAAGKAADARADVWAFGVVLFEMLSGQRPFGGESVSYVLAAVLKDDPDVAGLSDTAPPRLRSLIERCLRKDRRQRLQAIGEARVRLAEMAADPAALVAVGEAVGNEGATRQRRLEVPAVAPGSARLEAVITPDGTRVISVQQEEDGTTGLYVYSIDTGERRRIALEEDWPSNLFVSPDSVWLGYLVQDGEGIKRVRIDGGVPESVHEVFLPMGAAWLDEETVVFSAWAEDGVARVSTRDDEVQRLTELDPEKDEVRHWVVGPGPGPGEVLLRVQRGRRAGEGTLIETLNIESGERRTLREIDGWQGAIAAGSLLWIEDGTLLRTPITPDGRADGPASMVVEGVRRFSVSDDGTLLLDRQTRSDLYKMFWVDLDGRRTREDGLERPLVDPSFSPDGRFLAGHSRDQAKVHDIARGITTEPLPDTAREILVSWSGDGKDVVLVSDRDGGVYRMYRMAADGSGQPEPLIDDDGDPPFRVVVGATHDGRSIVYCEPSEDNGWDIRLLREGEEPRVSLATPADECGTLFGDGRWLVYQSEETGQDELFARAVEGPGRWQLTTTGVRHSLFVPERDEVYYMLPGKLMRIRLDTTGDELVPGRPEVRVEGRFQPMGISRFCAVAPDGRVLLPELDPEAASQQGRLEVWLGWGGFGGTPAVH